MIRDENIKILMKILVLFHHNYKITAEVNEIIAKYCLQQTSKIIFEKYKLGLSYAKLSTA